MMMLCYEIIENDPRTIVLSIEGKIDYSTYQDLIHSVRQKLAGKDFYLIIDFKKCEYVSISGIVALYHIALMVHHIPPISLENGWNAIRSIADETRNLKACLKIIHLQPKVKTVLANSGLLACIDYGC